LNQPARTGKQAAHYDAFISYSHAADAELARVLRDELQGFATPWSPWRWINPRRSLRVFRDQASLAADPALWPAIEAALHASDWFVLLASEAAAESPWIDKEVSFWCEHKRTDRILLVLTGGELYWNPDLGDFDPHRSTALPRRLVGTFANEPLWLDLRWSKSSARVDPGDPRFQDALASISAPIRGVPKDELIGEDIRQQRRLSRWRNAALATLSIALLSALAAGEIARRQRGLALEREAEAVTERTRATHQAGIALARQLAAQSVQIRLQSVARIEVSLLLAVEATRRAASLETTQALTQALALTPPRLDSFQHRWGPVQPSAMVLGIAYSPDGRLLASTNEDGSLALWELGGEQRWHEELSPERLRAVAFRPDGRLLAAGGEEGKVFLLKVENGVQLAAIDHDGPISALAFDASGRLLATASEDGTARISEVDGGREIGRLSFGAGDLAQVEDVAFSPDGQLVAAINEGGRICFWNRAAGRPRDCLSTGAQGLHLAFSPDSKMIAGASENFASVWGIASGKRLHRFEHPDLLGDAKMAHFLWINELAFRPDGQYLATASRDRTARVWALGNGQEALRLDHAGPVATLAFAPDGRSLATATDVGTVQVWEMLSGREMFRIGNATGQTIQTLAFTPDGQRLAAADWSGEIDVWSMRSALEGARLHHRDDVKMLAFSPDGRFLATSTDDHIIHLWATDRWTEIAQIKRFAPKRLLFADDSKHLLVESQQGGLELMSVGETLQPVQLAGRPSGDAILTPRFAVLSRQGQFDIWRAAGGEQLAQGLGRALPIDAYDLHSEATLLAISYQGEQAIEVWDLAAGKPASSVPVRSKVFRIAIGPRGDRLAVVHGERAEGAGRYEPLDFRVEIRGLRNGEVLANIPLGRLEPQRMTFMPDGQHLLLATGDWQFPNDVHVIDLTAQNSRYTLDDVGEIHTLRIAPGGRYLAISNGHRVRIWDIDTGRAVGQLPTSGYTRDIGFTPDGRYLATASDDNDLTLWPWRADDLIDLACRHATRNLTRKEWQDFLPNDPYRASCPNLPADASEK
jgi:WD40 repeat protein